MISSLLGMLRRYLLHLFVCRLRWWRVNGVFIIPCKDRTKKPNKQAFFVYTKVIFAQSPLGLLLSWRKGYNASLSLKPRRLFISLHEQRNEAKKFAVCTFLPTPALFSAKQKELASLKQLFVFYAPKSPCASRQKSEAGPFRFFRNIATLVGCGCFRDPSLHFISLWMTRKEIGCAMKSRSFTTLCSTLDDKEMNSRAKRCALQGGLFRPPWKSVKKNRVFSVKNEKLFER